MRSSARATSSSASEAESAGGFSTKTCLPASSASARELVVRRHRRGDDDGLEGVVLQEILESARHAGARVAGAELVEQVGGEVAEPGQLGEVVEVAGEVRAPVAEAGEANPHQSFQTFSLAFPL